MQSRITKFAAAAVLALAVLLLARHLTGRERPVVPGDRNTPIVKQSDNQVSPAPIPTVQEPEPVRLARELESARRFFAAADAKGLLGLLDTGLDQTKIAIAGYLGQMKEESAVPALQWLADRWQGPPNDNPFRKSLEQIRGSSSGQSEPVGAIGMRAAATDGHEQRITIQVLEKTTGTPIADAVVNTFSFGDTEYHHYTTDEKGATAMDLAGSTPEYVRVRVDVAGYVGQSVELWEVRGSSLPRTVHFSLEKGTVVGGVVQDQSGQPIQGASVETHLSEETSGQGFEQPCVFVVDTQTTDEQGRWRSDKIPAHVDGLSFEVSHPDFADRQLAMPVDLTLEDLLAERAVIMLTKGLTVTGRVTDARGTGIAGARLLAGMNHSMGQWIQTDATGCFSCMLQKMVIQNQKFCLTAQVPGFASQRREMSVDGNPSPVEFVLQPASLLLGRVVDSRGRPVEGVSVSAADWKGSSTIQWETKTDSNGAFAWDYPPADAVQIALYKAGYTLSCREVVADDREQTLVLAKAMSIRGAVTDSRTGERVRRFKVVPGRRTNNGSYASWNTSDTATKWFTDGRYEYTFLFDAQAYAVRIEADGYLPAESAFVDANEQGATIDMALTKGEAEQGPSGYVFDANAVPVAGAQVVWSETVLMYDVRADVHGRIYTTTDKDGHFAFKASDRQDPRTSDSQAPFLVVCDQGIGGASCEELARNGFIMLKPWARVEGQWRIGSKPAANQELSLWPWLDQALSQACLDRAKVVTDENGRFVFEKVYPGKFTLYNEIFWATPGRTLNVAVGGEGRIVKGELTIPSSSDTTIRAGLTVVPATVPIPFDKIPKPPGYEQMSFDEVRTWLERFSDSPEGKAYSNWLSQTNARSFQHLRVDMDDRSRFHVDNVEPGAYILRGEVKSGGFYDGRVMAVAPGQEHLLAKQIGSVWHEFEVPPPASDDELDVPHDLGALPVRLMTKPQQGDPAPDFDLPTFGEGRVRLADYRGKVVLVTFFMAGCLSTYPQGREELKAIYRLFCEDDRYAQIGLFFESYPLLAKKAADKAELGWPLGLIWEHGGRETREYDLPSKTLWNVVIDAQGRIFARDLEGEDLESAIDAALQTVRRRPWIDH
jgi:protocatechuate 3,4-dioxygenase beta subunit